jgi:hypothetical protein
VAIAVSSRQRALTAADPFPPAGKLDISPGPGLFAPPIEPAMFWRELIKSVDSGCTPLSNGQPGV